VPAAEVLKCKHASTVLAARTLSAWIMSNALSLFICPSPVLFFFPHVHRSHARRWYSHCA